MKERFRCCSIDSSHPVKIFFDTNVILSLFTSLGVRKNADEYSRFYGACLQQKKELYIDTHVLSEFINAYLRLEYRKYLRAQNIDSSTFNFKDYRSCSEGLEALSSVEAVVKNRLLKKFILAGKRFCCDDIASFSLAGKDFNDLLIVEICKEHELALATDDSDFLDADIAVISENSVYHASAS